MTSLAQDPTCRVTETRDMFTVCSKEVSARSHLWYETRASRCRSRLQCFFFAQTGFDCAMHGSIRRRRQRPNSNRIQLGKRETMWEDTLMERREVENVLVQLRFECYAALFEMRWRTPTKTSVLEASPRNRWQPLQRDLPSARQTLRV